MNLCLFFEGTGQISSPGTDPIGGLGVVEQVDSNGAGALIADALLCQGACGGYGR